MSVTAGMVGADADQLDALARDIAHTADRIDGIRVEVGGRLHHTSWDGPDAQQARSDWDHRHAGALVRVAASLRERGGLLTTEAEAQRRASADDGGAAGPAALHPRPSGGTDWVALDAVFGSAGVLGIVAGGAAALHKGVSVAALLTRKANTIGRYTKGWAAAIDKYGDLLRYKRSPVLQALGNSKVLTSVGGLAAKTAFKRLGGALNAIDAGTHLYDVAGSLRDGDYTGAAHHTASAMKAIPGPVGQLAALNVEVWTQVYEAATEIDLSQGLPNPLAPGAIKDIYAPAFGEATMTVAGRIGSFLLD
jgi:hypothetical protein